MDLLNKQVSVPGSQRDSVGNDKRLRAKFGGDTSTFSNEDNVVMYPAPSGVPGEEIIIENPAVHVDGGLSGNILSIGFHHIGVDQAPNQPWFDPAPFPPPAIFCPFEKQHNTVSWAKIANPGSTTAPGTRVQFSQRGWYRFTFMMTYRGSAAGQYIVRANVARLRGGDFVPPQVPTQASIGFIDDHFPNTTTPGINSSTLSGCVPIIWPNQDEYPGTKEDYDYVDVALEIIFTPGSTESEVRFMSSTNMSVEYVAPLAPDDYAIL